MQSHRTSLSFHTALEFLRCFHTHELTQLLQQPREHMEAQKAEWYIPRLTQPETVTNLSRALITLAHRLVVESGNLGEGKRH